MFVDDGNRGYFLAVAQKKLLEGELLVSSDEAVDISMDGDSQDVWWMCMERIWIGHGSCP